MPTDGQLEGAQLGLSLSEHMAASLAWTAPYRCARFLDAPADPQMQGVSWQEDRGLLLLEPGGKNARFATIADVRGDGDVDVQALHGLRDALNNEKIDVLVTLGGLGTDGAAIGQILSALSENANYVVLAIPGDRESVRAHREAVANLAVKGKRVLDGSNYRFAQLGRLRLITMPGIASAGNLVAGAEGCVHAEADVDALAERLKTLGAPALLLSYAPWREEGPSGSDYGLGAIHMGERLLASLRTSEHVVGLVHGMQGSELPQSDGTMVLGQPAESISAGSLDPLDASPSALVLTVSGARLTWKRLPVHWSP